MPIATRKRPLRDRVADYFRAHPNVWVRGRAFFGIGGECAWRTRISDCRTQLGMEIRSKTVSVFRKDATTGVPRCVRRISYYQFVPPPVLTVDRRGRQRLFE